MITFKLLSTLYLYNPYNELILYEFFFQKLLNCMSETVQISLNKETKKRLYDYQIADLKRIFEVFDAAPDNYNLL